MNPKKGLRDFARLPLSKVGLMAPQQVDALVGRRNEGKDGDLKKGKMMKLGIQAARL